MELLVDIQKNLGRFQLDVAFSCGQETLALLGGSGCGKSLTLQCIAGIETPDAGRIILNGRTLFDAAKGINLPPQERRIGLVFQNYALFPNLTVAENIRICQSPKGTRRDVARFNDLLQRFQLADLVSALPGQLSGGQQQRVALARIFAMDPEILMLDEPFSALDSYLKWQLELDLMQVLQAFRQPVLFVSHNRDEVYRLCDRIAVMNEGHIESLSDKHELFANPQTRQAATLTGCKNYSRAIRLGNRQILAIDWGEVLTVAADVPDDLSGVGIRAHSFHIAKQPDEPNQISVTVQHLIESPFSTLVVAQCAQASAKSWLRWEFSSSQRESIAKPLCDWSPGANLQLAVAPDQLLLLH